MNHTLPKVAESLIVDIIRDGMHKNTQSLAMRSRQLASKLKRDYPELSENIGHIVSASVLRGQSTSVKPIPVDSDSRQRLVREEFPVLLQDPLVWPQSIEAKLNAFVKERTHSELLLSEGLAPSRSLLMTGPPGCGKTSTARWVAHTLNLPLFTLDLATVMSSYLGKTGSNIRAVLDHAQSTPCVLLLDEFDAIAKRRDDDSDVGELKRLVTVLLQAIDDWPTESVLIGATNHGELLDPAVWRRFDIVIDFPAPTNQQVLELLSNDFELWLARWLSERIKPESIASLRLSLRNIRKQLILENNSIYEGLVSEFSLSEDPRELEFAVKSETVLNLLNAGESQRKISVLTGLSRPSVKKIIENANMGIFKQRELIDD